MYIYIYFCTTTWILASLESCQLLATSRVGKQECHGTSTPATSWQSLLEMLLYASMSKVTSKMKKVHGGGAVRPNVLKGQKKYQHLGQLKKKYNSETTLSDLIARTDLYKDLRQIFTILF